MNFQALLIPYYFLIGNTILNVKTVKSTLEKLDLQIISAIPNLAVIPANLPWTATPLLMSVEDAQKRFSNELNISLTLLFNPNDRNCDETDATTPDLLAEYYYRNFIGHCSVIIAAACGGLSTVPYLAREWDVLLLTNSITVDKVFNPITNPASIAMAGTYDGISIALLKLLTYFKWSHVTVLTDSQAVTEYYRLVTESLVNLARSNRFGQYHLDAFTFTLTSDNDTVLDLIRLATSRSRVFILFSNTSTAIEFLRLARTSGIVQGAEEYVFIVPQAMPWLLFGSPALFDNPTKEDLPFFRSVLYLNTYGMSGNGTMTDELNEELAQKQEQDYGTVLESRVKPLDLFTIRETYSAIQLAAQIVNESRATRHGHCSGRHLRKLMAMRRFSFQSGVVDFDQDSARNPDLLLYSFGIRINKMQITARFESASLSWEKAGDLIEWQSGNAPLDVPICGFDGLDEPCKSQASQKVMLAVVAPTVALVATIVMIFGLSICYRRSLKSKKREWWHLHWQSLGASVGKCKPS